MQRPHRSPPSKAWFTWPTWTSAIILIIIAIISFQWLHESTERQHLIHPDEGRYAEIPREMVATGDWVTPRINGIKFFEKPPLQYWATASAFSLFGDHNWVARLWPLLTGFAGLLACLYASWRLFGQTVAVTATGMLASALLYVLFAFVITLDMGLTFFLTAALMSFLLAQRAGEQARHERRWMWWAWAMMGCAVLSKGLIGVVLPGMVLTAYVLSTRDWALLRRLHIVTGTALLLLITLPWIILLQSRHPEFARYFFLHEHFERFTMNTHNRTNVPGYFVGVLAAGFMPWTPFFIVAMLTRLRDWRGLLSARSKGPVDAERVLWLWAVITLAFFTVSTAKLPAYILPMFPAIAIITALAAWRLQRRGLIVAIVPTLILALAGFVALPLLRTYAVGRYPVELVDNYVPALRAALGWLAAGASAALIAAWCNRRALALGALALGSFTAWDVMIENVDVLAPSLSAVSLIQRAEQSNGAFDRDVPMFSVGMYDQTLPFYLKRVLIPVKYGGDLLMGMKLEPQLAIETVTGFRKKWAEIPRAYAVISMPTYREMLADGWSARELQKDADRVILAKP